MSDWLIGGGAVDILVDRPLASPGPAQVFAGPGEVRALLRALDWAATPLGPVQHWSGELITSVRLVLNSGLPVLLMWGPELIQLYNDACLLRIADRHPRALGQPAAQIWADVWPTLGPVVDSITSGQRSSARFDEHLMFLDRGDFLEETYQTFAYSAVTDIDGFVLGLHVHNGDLVTERVLGARRLRTLRELGTVSPSAPGGVIGAAREIIAALSANRADLPFATIALLDQAGRPQPLGSFGLYQPGIAAEFAGAGSVRTDRPEPRLLTGLAARLRGYFDPQGALSDSVPDSAMLLPLTEHGRSRTVGELLLGVSPHRRLDSDYRDFLSLVADQVSTSLTDAVAFAAERHRAESLADLDAAKTRFFQNISHELRTPLTLLLGPLRQALDDPDLPLAGHRDPLEAAHRAALRLKRLVDGLLEVARGEAGRIHPAAESTDLGALTAECVSMFRSVIEGAGLELVLRIPQTARAVQVDRQMWAQIVFNLLSNAVKFTPAGTIEVQLESTDQEATLQVTDTGIGIADPERELIFDRFHQVGGRTARSPDGVGIGLSLVSDLVRAHGGTIQVASVPGSGSTFAVHIPAAGQPQAPPRPLEAPVEVAETFLADAAQWQGRDDPATGDPVAARPPGGRGRVLVVDDSADMRRYLTRLLVRDGWEVTAAAGVDEALRHRVVPDLVLTDVMMPDRNGLDLLRLLRAAPDGDRLPVILLTARAGPESVVEGLELGADDYLVKPFEPVELLARVRSTIELHRNREERLIRATDQAANLEAALTTNRRIGTAVGILMAGRKINSEQAFSLLSSVSQAAHRKLRDVAEDVTRTGELPVPARVHRAPDRL